MPQTVDILRSGANVGNATLELAMKILVLSDTHNEHRNDGLYGTINIDGVDACIVAGDFGNPISRVIHQLQEVSQGKIDIIYVAGNHDHYGQVYGENIAEGYRACDECPNVHFLENQTLILNGVRFLGATLWTDYELYGKAFVAKEVALKQISDFGVIREDTHKYATPDFFAKLHKRSRMFLSSVLEVPYDDGPTIVVTHHAPHPSSIAPRFYGQVINAAYASDLTELIFKGEPALWVHGHTHFSFDYEIFNTKILCNPAGYPHLPNPEFKDRLIIDTDLLKKPGKMQSYEELFSGLL